MAAGSDVFASAADRGVATQAPAQRESAPTRGPKLELDAITQTFETPAGRLTAVEDVSIAIEANQFVSVIGPSGCGKSTLFNIIAGLQKPSSGTVRLDGRDVSGRIGGLGYMLQKDLLLAWRSVLDNVILGMELRNAPKTLARQRALAYFERYGLGGFERQYPAVLSGGMRQRAALLRTLLYDSEVILLDEPFGALDAQTRVEMQQWLLQIWADFSKTVVFVTHDVEEAILLSDKIFVMSSRPGRIVATLDVPLPRPRPPDVADDPVFVLLKRRCFELLAESKRPVVSAAAPSATNAASAPPVSQPPPAPTWPRPLAADRPLRVEKPWPASLLFAVQLAIVAGVLLTWEIGVRAGWIDVFFWSSPSRIFKTFGAFVSSGAAYSDTLFTFSSTIMGFVFGTAFGSIIGLSFWWSRNYARIAQPFLICFEATPKLALAPLIVLVFGIGLASKVALGVALTLVVTTLTTFTAVRAVDPDSARLMYSLGARRWQVFTKLVVPSVLPWIVSSLRINIGLALTGAVIGEFISSQHGLGREILYASQTYDIALIWVAVAVLAALSIVMYLLIGWLEKILLKELMHGARV